jgi:hypothetical protein
MELPAINNEELDRLRDELDVNLTIEDLGESIDPDEINADDEAAHQIEHIAMFVDEAIPEFQMTSPQQNFEIIDDLEIENENETLVKFDLPKMILKETVFDGDDVSEKITEVQNNHEKPKAPIVIERTKRQPPSVILEAERKYNEMLEKQRAALRPKQSGKKGREVNKVPERRKLTTRRTSKRPVDIDVPEELNIVPVENAEILPEPQKEVIEETPKEIYVVKESSFAETVINGHPIEHVIESTDKPVDVPDVDAEIESEIESPRSGNRPTETRTIIERERPKLVLKTKPKEEEKPSIKILSTTTRNTNIVGSKNKNSSVTTTHHVLDRSTGIKKARIPNAIYKHMEQDIKKKTIQNAKNLEDLRRISALQDIIPEMGIDIERATLIELRKLKAKQQHERRAKEAQSKPEPSERTQKIDSILNNTKLSNFQKMVALRNSALSTRHAAGVPIKPKQ